MIQETRENVSAQKENVALQRLRILYMFVLRTRKPTTFDSNVVVGFFVRNTNINKISQGYFFRIYDISPPSLGILPISGCSIKSYIVYHGSSSQESFSRFFVNFCRKQFETAMALNLCPFVIYYYLYYLGSGHQQNWFISGCRWFQ